MNDEIKIGTKIRALVDKPDGGSVKKDEIGIIIENGIADFPSQKRYYIGTYPLNKSKYEIVSEEFINTKPLYGRWYKVLVDNPKQIPYLKKGDYAKSDGENSFLEFSNGRNSSWSCSEFKNDIWELMPEGFEPETTITNTFGLKIGDTLPKEIINKWCNQGLNYYGYAKKWESQSLFSTDRVILSFKLLDGVLGFEVSDTANIYLKAEGFKEFMDNFDKKENNKFEVGKWYKTERGSIVKLKEIDNIGLFKASEHFMWSDLKKLGYEGTFGDISKNNFILLTDLSEIQPYLPDGHPDKINTIPEYVEYINTKYKGQIVKVEEWKYNSYCKVIFANGNKESPFKHLVKPSTKEAYDTQENSKPKDMEKSEFKKGEYIVLISTPVISHSYPKNFIFRQKENAEFLVSVIDNSGSKTNSWFSIKPSDEYWRYATPEEITEYERLGKPYDVTRLNKSNIKKWSIDTYVVFVKEGHFGVKQCLTSCTSEIGIIGKISNYYESETITACENISPYVFEKNLVEWFATREEAEVFAKTLINKNTLQELPEKWYCCPENEEQDRILCNWRKGGHSSPFNEAALLSDKIWIYKKNIDTSIYTKISFEQFEKHYLNKSQLSPHLAVANIEDKGPDFSNYTIRYDPYKKEESPQKAKPKIAITDIPTTQPIVIKLNKKINYLIPKSI